MSYLHDQLLGGSSVGIMSHSRNHDEQYKAHRGDCSDDKRNILFSANDFPQTTCMIFVWDMIYISRFMKKADRKVTLLYPSPPHLAGCDAAEICLLELTRLQTNQISIRL